MQPGDTHARALAEAMRFRSQLFHRADHLVPRDDGRLARRQFALHHVQIRAAHTAGVYANQNLAAPRPRNVNLRELERIAFHRSRSLKYAGPHSSPSIYFESSNPLADIILFDHRML